MGCTPGDRLSRPAVKIQLECSVKADAHGVSTTAFQKT